MILTFFSDPHLGVQRRANTSPASAAALQEAIYHQGIGIVDSAPGPVICLGDVFDKYSNSEAILRQGLDIVSGCELVLAGNHDVVGREERIGSLQMIDYMIQSSPGGWRSPVVIAPFGEARTHRHVMHNANVDLVAIPHVATQALFEAALDAALAESPAPDGYAQMLLLHCNYNLPPDIATETSLNLTDAHIERLLDVYHFILLGHEHAPDLSWDGRVIRLGNIHPTGFADISDKYAAQWDTETEQFSFWKVWNAGTGYLEVDCEAVPETTQAQFVRVTGRAAPETLARAYRVVDCLWSRSPSLFGVKMDLKRAETDAGAAPALPGQQRSLTDLVEADLKEAPEMLALWKELAAEAGEG